MPHPAGLAGASWIGLSDSDQDMYGFIHRLALQSRKGTVMRLWIMASLSLFLLQACMEQDMLHSTTHAPPDSTASGNSALQQLAPGDTDLLHSVADDQTAGRNPPRAFTYLDTATGKRYQINSGWRVLPRQPKKGTSGQPLAKTAGGLMQTWTDWSGQVETRIYECVTPTLAQHQSLGCQVEPGFILTGGGAYADYGTGQGALLWESRPLDESLVTWMGSSKDHIAANPHILHVYAIGMRLKDNGGNYIPVTTLRGIIKMKRVTSNPPTHDPYMEQTGPIYLGGGARANWVCCGSMFTDLWIREYRESAYFALATDHISHELSTLDNYVIYANPSYGCCQHKVSIPYFGDLLVAWQESKGSTVATGVATAYRDATPGWVITGPGAASLALSVPNRLLFGVKPTGTYQGQIGAFSKDHRLVSSGYATVYFAEVQKCCR
jgi:hypothetical protein